MLGASALGGFGSPSQTFLRRIADAGCMDRPPKPATRHPARRSRVAAGAASAIATIAIAGYLALGGTPTRTAAASAGRSSQTTAGHAASTRPAAKATRSSSDDSTPAATQSSTQAATPAAPATSANTSSGGS
jgi:hypothetical protein